MRSIFISGRLMARTSGYAGPGPAAAIPLSTWSSRPLRTASERATPRHFGESVALWLSDRRLSRAPPERPGGIRIRPALRSRDRPPGGGAS